MSRRQPVQPVSARVAAVLGVDAEPLEVPPLVLWPGELRIKLQDAAPGWAFIHTHRQVGHRLWPEREEHW